MTLKFLGLAQAVRGDGLELQEGSLGGYWLRLQVSDGRRYL